jgi:hypothetical protein
MPGLIGTVDATGSLSTTTVMASTSNTSLYLPFDSDVNDNSPSAHSGTAANSTAITNTHAKFGSFSLGLNGSNEYVTYSNHADFQFGSGDFTIEAFVYFTGSPGDGASAYTIVRKFSYDSSNQQEYLLQIAANNVLEFVYSSNGSSSSNLTSTSYLTASTWHHVAVTRAANILTLFLDGSSVGTASFSGALFSGTEPLYIGGRPDSQTMFAGYIDDVRILKGNALYTANFTTPSSALTASAATNVTDSRAYSSIWSMSSQTVVNVF